MNTTTRQNEEIVFYIYYEHLKKFGFEWENTTTEFKFSIELEYTLTNLGFGIWAKERNVKRLSYTMAYMLESEFNVVSVLNKTDSYKKLSMISPAEKNSSLRIFSKQAHETNRVNVFYSNYYRPDNVLFHALDSVLLFDAHKIERLCVPKIYHDKTQLIFF